MVTDSRKSVTWFAVPNAPECLWGLYDGEAASLKILKVLILDLRPNLESERSDFVSGRPDF